MDNNISTDYRATVGNFHNTMNSLQGSAPNERRFEEMVRVSNIPSNQGPSTHALAHNAHYWPLSIEGERQGNCLAPVRITNAMKQRPLATAIALTAAVLATVTVAGIATQRSGGSALAAPGSDHVPQPLPLVMSVDSSAANSATVVGICGKSLCKFPQSNGAQVICPPMAKLRSIEGDAERILRTARSMVQDSAVGSEELQEAAECSGVRLMGSKVDPLMASLREERQRLIEEAGGTSIDQPIRILATRIQVAEIERKLSVLGDIKRHLYDATVTINQRLLELAG